MDFRIQKASTPEDQSMVDDLIHEHFMPDMPLSLAFGWDESSQPRTPSPPKPDEDADSFCLIAVDAQDRVIGAAINKATVTYEMKPDAPLQWKQMVEFLKWVDQDARLDTLPEKTIELRLLAVHREWRQRGVAKTLALESMKEARERGFQAMRVCCTSEYTARLARALGWRQHYSLRYADYPSRAGVDVTLTPAPPHDYVYFYVTDL